MKRLFQYSALATVLLCLSASATQQEKEKAPVLTLEKHEGGKLVVKDPGSLFLCNENGSYIIRNGHADKTAVITRWAGDRFWGITEDKAIVNHKEQMNPLYGATIDSVGYGKDKTLCVVTANQPATFFMLTSIFAGNVQIISAQNIKDTQGNAIKGIAGMMQGTETIQTEEKKIVEKKEVKEKKTTTTHYTLLAVKNAAGVFGDLGSGIALLRYDAGQQEEKEQEKEESKKKAEPFFDIINATTGALQGNKPYPIDNTTPALSVNGGVESLGTVVDMFWDVHAHCCYIALQLKTKRDARADQGGCALLIARIKNGALQVEPAIQHSALSSNSVVGALGADKYVSLHKVRTMQLSTGSLCAVVVGGNGKPEETSSMVYALPLLDGMLASKNIQQGDEAVRVGGTAVLPGPIVDVAVQKECIVVAVKEDGNGQAAGAFYSQPIFDEHGVVATWTAWQRVVGGEKNVVRVFPSVAQCRFVHEEGGSLADETTAWHKSAAITVGGASAQLSYDAQQACVGALFPHNNLFGITDYPAQTPGISGNDTLSMMAFLGTGTVALLQTSEADAQGIVRSVRDYSADSNRALLYTSPELDRCGTLTCSTIAVHGDNAWLFVGGTQGLAVLAQADGSGWNARAGLGNGFAAIREGFAFKKLAMQKVVRKLACANGYLYILTNKSLERIALARRQWDAPEVIMHNDKVVFNDMLVSDSLLLVATSAGFYSIDAAGGTKTIELPHDEPLSVTQLFAVSPTGCEQDFARKGNVYCVARSRNYRETYIYRFFVDTARDHDRVVRIPEHPTKKKKSSYWLRYAAPQQQCIIDCATVYNYCSRLKKAGPHVSYIPALQGNNKSIFRARDTNQLPLGIEDDHAVRAMVRNSATGSWLVAGDFGIRVNK